MQKVTSVLLLLGVVLFNHNAGRFIPAQRQAVTPPYAHTDRITEGSHGVQPHLITRQTTHFQKFQRHSSVAKRLNDSTFPFFQIGYIASGEHRLI